MSQMPHNALEQQRGDEAAEPVPSTPDDVAHAFAEVHGQRLRYVADWKSWLVWDGMRWRRDRTLQVPDLVRQVSRVVAADMPCDSDEDVAQRIAQRLGSAASVAAVERMARTDQRLAGEPEQWDADPDLLNTQAGIVDTRTGALSPHRADACMSRITATAPAAPGAPHPLWSAFLDRITGGDADLAFYLQRVAGYTLTGRGGEHALFFAHGTGANGKTTFIDTLARILGDYADVASLDALVSARDGRVAAELGRLDGARLVTVEDMSDGRAWPAARLKLLTGGDRVLARDGRALRPRFKLMVAGSERPSFARVDEGLRRRLHLIPFAVTIPEAERDAHLAEKLEAEHAAILRWAIDGALAWHRMGLAPPDCVRQARDHHLEFEDTLGLWMSESTAAAAPTAWTSSADLYASWCAWAVNAGERPGCHKRFSQMLEARGFAPKRIRTGQRGFVGIELAVDDASFRLRAEASDGGQARVIRHPESSKTGASRQEADAASPASAPDSAPSTGPAEPRPALLPKASSRGSRRGPGDSPRSTTTAPAPDASSRVISHQEASYGGQARVIAPDSTPSSCLAEPQIAWDVIRQAPQSPANGRSA